MTADLEDIYRDLHTNPELSRQENRTAGIAEAELRRLGYDVVAGIGGTGVVGVLRNGDGPTALLRADMDALPVEENTGLPYASTARATDPDGNVVPVMHACGHDMHVTCLIGAARELAADRSSWNGTLVVLFQPAEEVGGGATGMVEDGLYDRVPKPDIVLGQHVAPIPAGMLAVRPGPAMAATDSMRVTLYGRGGHGSRPESTIDPIVMAAAIVMRLQTVVSREISGNDMAVVTVGYIRGGTKDNIIPDDAEIQINIRSVDPDVHDRVIAAVKRIIYAEAAASGAERDPKIVPMDSFSTLINDPEATLATVQAFEAKFGQGSVFDPGPITGSEDVGELATAIGVPCVYWILGGCDPALFAEAKTADEVARIAWAQPSNHSPLFAPVIQPTLQTGVAALVTAAHRWLLRPQDRGL